MVPVFQLDSDLPERQITAVATRLGVRNALSPATFTLEDAQLLCRRLEELSDATDIEDTHLRDVIRPAYRELREQFWLYLVGSLRADLPSHPYLRAIKDPFGSLYSEEMSVEGISSAVQLRVREFEQAEELYLVRDADPELDS